MGGRETDTDSAALAPAEAFGLVGHEHRVEILRALLDECSRDGEYPTSFSTLRRRTDIDVSAQFSYHLDELTGHFVRRTAEGYELRYAGWEVATSILAGTYNQRAAFGPTHIEGTCAICGMDELRATYREEWMQITCAECETTMARYTFPPGAIESRSVSSAVEAFDSHVRSHMSLTADGICPSCYGIVDVEVSPDGAAVYDDRVAIRVCRRCGNRLTPRLGMFLLEEDRIRRFFQRQGADLSSIPFWELAFCVDGDAENLAGTDPWRCELHVVHDGAQLVVTVDDSLTVTDADDPTHPRS